MIINHNLAALNTLNALSKNEKATNSSLEKLSSGYRINSASDDAAGLAISEKMRGQIRGLDKASDNAQDGISLVQTAEGALSETTDILQRMRELAVQASNDTETDSDRTACQDEISQLSDEIDRIANTTQFNTKTLLNGSLAKSTTAQGTILTSTKLYTAASTTAGSTATLTGITDADGNSLGLTSGDIITIEGDIDGQAQTAVTFQITGATSVDALTSQIETALGLTAGSVTVSTSGTTSGSIIISGATGTTNALSNVTLSATSSDGETERSAFNTAFTDIATTQAATDANTDSSLTFQIGANEDQTMKVDINKMDAEALSLSYIDVSTQDGAENAISIIDDATSKVSTERAKLGAYENRLEHTINNLSTTSENMTSAESNIRDVDMAAEMAEYQKNSVLQQAAQSMLAQANQQPQQVLSLLK